MGTTTKQKQKYCPACQRSTLHVATIQTVGMGGFAGLNLVLSVITCGLWIPVAVFLIGLAAMADAFAPLTAKYLCQQCGRRN